MVVIWRPLTFDFDHCPVQHSFNTVRPPEPTLRRNRLSGMPNIVEYVLIMRDKILSIRTPSTVTQLPPRSEEASVQSRSIHLRRIV